MKKNKEKTTKEKLLRRINEQTKYIEQLEKEISMLKACSEKILKDELFLKIFEVLNKCKMEMKKEKEILKEIENLLKESNVNYKIKSGKLILSFP